MILQGLKLRSVIDIYCALRPPDLPATKYLTAEDWQLLAEIKDILQLFLRFTKAFEGKGLP